MNTNVMVLLVTKVYHFWMHVGGGDVPEKLTFEDELVKRIQRITYLGSVLDGDGDATSAINANFQRAKYQILCNITLCSSQAS